MPPREEGLAVSLNGVGIGPKVKFLEYDSDFGQTVVHTEKRTEIELSNQVWQPRFRLSSAATCTFLYTLSQGVLV